MQPSNVHPLHRGVTAPLEMTASGPVAPQPAAIGFGPEKLAKLTWTPILDNADPSVRSRWVWAILLVGAAAWIGSHALEMIATREPTALVEIGLGRIVQAAREWPVLRPLVAVVVEIEHLLAAGVLVWLSIIVLRKVPVPRPAPTELLVVATRQVRHLRIDLALSGLLCLGLGAVLAAHADDALAVTAHYRPTVHRIPAGLLILAAGLVEFYGLQRLLRAVVAWGVPAVRSYLVVIADPQHRGMNNRLCFGDGRFAGAGQRIVYHGDILDVRHRISAFRGRVLGLSDLILTIADNGKISTVTIEAPALIGHTQQIVDTLAGIWRAAQPRPASGVVQYVNQQR